MSYFERIDSFMEYEKNQGRHWRKKSMFKLFYSNSVTGNSLYEYPLLWILTNPKGHLCNVTYEMSHHMGFALHLEGIWFEHNIHRLPGYMRVTVGSIRQFWH